MRMARFSDIAPVDDVMFSFIAAISANVHPRTLGSQAARSYMQYDNRKYRTHVSIPGQSPAIGVSDPRDYAQEMLRLLQSQRHSSKQRSFDPQRELGARPESRVQVSLLDAAKT